MKRLELAIVVLWMTLCIFAFFLNRKAFYNAEQMFWLEKSKGNEQVALMYYQAQEQARDWAHVAIAGLILVPLFYVVKMIFVRFKKSSKAN